MRYRAPFTLVKRTINKKKKLSVYYYRLATDPARILHSTGQTSKPAARAVVEALLARPRGADVTLGEYAAGFWGPDCPHLRRLADEGRQVTARYAKQQRAIVEHIILEDPLARKTLGDISRGDVLAFRSRLRAVYGDRVNSVNKAMAALKTVIREAIIHEVLDREPCAGVGNIRETRAVRGVFTRDELAALFAESPGPWGDQEAFTAFYLAAVTGARRGEILALHWRALDIEAGTVRVEEAWKGGEVIGRPKSGKVRTAPLTRRACGILRDWFDESARCAPDDFVFCDRAGRMRGETWWSKHFRRAMTAAGINTAGRNLTAHSFRHTLNTLLRDAGLDPAKIRAALGWSGERIQDQYTHWQAEHLREQARKIEEFGL